MADLDQLLLTIGNLGMLSLVPVYMLGMGFSILVLCWITPLNPYRLALHIVMVSYAKSVSIESIGKSYPTQHILANNPIRSS